MELRYALNINEQARVQPLAEMILYILIIASASADVSGDESAAKYLEMSAISWVLGHIWPQYPSFVPY